MALALVIVACSIMMEYVWTVAPVLSFLMTTSIVFALDSLYTPPAQVPYMCIMQLYTWRRHVNLDVLTLSNNCMMLWVYNCMTLWVDMRIVFMLKKTSIMYHDWPIATSYVHISLI